MNNEKLFKKLLLNNNHLGGISILLDKAPDWRIVLDEFSPQDYESALSGADDQFPDFEIHDPKFEVTNSENSYSVDFSEFQKAAEYAIKLQNEGI